MSCEIGTLRVKVLFFASLREQTGVPHVFVDLNSHECSLLALLKILCEKFSYLTEEILKEEISIARNQKYLCNDSFGEVILQNGDELALLPPISGG